MEVEAGEMDLYDFKLLQNTGRKEAQESARGGGCWCEGTEQALTFTKKSKKKLQKMLSKKVGQREHRMNAKQRAN